MVEALSGYDRRRSSALSMSLPGRRHAKFID